MFIQWCGLFSFFSLFCSTKKQSIWDSGDDSKGEDKHTIIMIWIFQPNIRQQSNKQDVKMNFVFQHTQSAIFSAQYNGQNAVSSCNGDQDPELPQP